MRRRQRGRGRGLHWARPARGVLEPKERIDGGATDGAAVHVDVARVADRDMAARKQNDVFGFGEADEAFNVIVLVFKAENLQRHTTTTTTTTTII